MVKGCFVSLRQWDGPCLALEALPGMDPGGGNQHIFWAERGVGGGTGRRACMGTRRSAFVNSGFCGFLANFGVDIGHVGFGGRVASIPDGFQEIEILKPIS